MSALSVNNCLVLMVFLVMITLIAARVHSQQELLDTTIHTDYKRLAKYCYIHDFELWADRQKELTLWLRLSKIMKLSRNDYLEIQKEVEQYRLQYECLKIIERLPLSIGPGRTRPDDYDGINFATKGHVELEDASF
ncbi:unnamed protein product [Didymodactylos carnosus]|uniref:Uncharacterized protein n=2 Tax=Didymodactylos carnosus TaxID=1234261 RepID=A0A815H1J0_9BILA|nr:unnamed protein product [Didymodactylos carnosus]CAF4211142.1 unnamed protein product [Didymodactylos carnosus]